MHIYVWGATGACDECGGKGDFIELIGAEHANVFPLVAHQLAYHLECPAGTLALYRGSSLI